MPESYYMLRNSPSIGFFFLTIPYRFFTLRGFSLNATKPESVPPQLLFSLTVSLTLCSNYILVTSNFRSLNNSKADLFFFYSVITIQKISLMAVYVKRYVQNTVSK